MACQAPNLCSCHWREMKTEKLALGSFIRAFPATESAGCPRLFTLPKHQLVPIPFIYYLVVLFPLLIPILMTYVNWYEENIIILKDKKWKGTIKISLNVWYFSLPPPPSKLPKYFPLISLPLLDSYSIYGLNSTARTLSCVQFKTLTCTDLKK